MMQGKPVSWNHRRFSMKHVLCALAILAAILAAPCSDGADLTARKAPKNGLWIETLDLSVMNQGFKRPQACKSLMGFPIALGGVQYPHGIGTHAVSEFLIDLKGAAVRFDAMAGVDDETRGQGSVAFEVWVDDRKVSETGLMRAGDKPREISVDLTGARYLLLMVCDGGDGTKLDHADWAGALLTLMPGAKEKPVSIGIGSEPPPPIASSMNPEPAIHGPRITGATPGRPFLFLIPATGEGPLTFEARDLPAGLVLDSTTGIITGALKQAGSTDVLLTASGPKGKASRTLTIAGGENMLALTPPLGWNSWNVWGVVVDDEKVRAAADALVSSGLAAHGFQYVNIDDSWEGDRDAKGVIQTNKRFPDMAALADYVHAKGLKLGIYSSPGPKTCAGYTGSYRHEQQDADTYAAWGIDYLKYDWCSYRDIAKSAEPEELKKPYRLMREALNRCGRDIVFSICQYGMGEVWTWGAEVGGNLWRTTYDIGDTWESVSAIGFAQSDKAPYAGPGHWNDPDMLVVGKVGWGPNVAPTRLAPNAQITHITLWCMLAAPLLIGCDLVQLDDFTRALLTNDEVLDVDQDPLGQAATRRRQEGACEVWARPLFDGTTAVALFNRGPIRRPVTASWDDVGVKGRQPVRDLWRQKDWPPAEGSITAEVPGRGAVLLKIGKVR